MPVNELLIKILIYTSSFSIFVLLGVLIFTNRKSGGIYTYTKAYLLFALYIITASYTEWTLINTGMRGIHNHFMTHIFCPLEFILLASLIITVNKKFKRELKVIVSPAIIITVLIQFSTNFEQVSGEAYTIQAFSLAFMALYTLLANNYSTKEQVAWILFSIFFYFSSTGFIFLFGFMGKLIILHHLHVCVNLLTNITLSLSFACKRL
ncbi:MAG: hypothetical protein A2V66_16885 [Ignavibacteria bacterium RBG_13_36_8]|nr:MAG: hypothetical protein A2V66_16885 [Ignavibacteria bacterium RBG_13_36_8]